MQELTLTRRLEIGEQLVNRVMEDKGFKAELYRDPKAALLRVFDLRIPDGVDIQVLEDTREVKHLLLPFEFGLPEKGSRSNPEPPDEQVAWYADLLERARQDGGFRHKLLNNPKTVLRDMLHIDLPESYDVRVIEETAGRRCLLLPYIIDDHQYDNELNDETLELVVGGKSSSENSSCSEQSRVKAVPGQRPARWRPRHVCG